MVAHSTRRSLNSEANQPPEGCGYYYVVRQNSAKEAKQQQQQKKFCHYVYEFKTIYLQLVNKKRSVQMYLCDC